MNQQPKFKGGNLINGTYRLVFINDEMGFREIQTLIVSTFFDFMDNFIKPFGIELCFERFDLENQFVLTKEKFEPYLLKTHHPNIDFTPIFTNTKIIQTDKTDFDAVLNFVDIKTKTIENQNFLTGLSHLSFQTGLFRLPTKIAARKFYLEKENQIDSAIEYECVSDEWFESPMQKVFLFPPIELNFSREPYSKAWSLLISLNWDMYSKKNDAGFQLLSQKLNLLVDKGWQLEYSGVF